MHEGRLDRSVYLVIPRRSYDLISSYGTIAVHAYPDYGFKRSFWDTTLFIPALHDFFSDFCLYHLCIAGKFAKQRKPAHAIASGKQASPAFFAGKSESITPG